MTFKKATTTKFSGMHTSVRKTTTHSCCCCCCFILSGFSFTDTDDWQDSRGREGSIFYSILPLPPAHEHWDIYLELCMWDDYHVFLIATLVFTRLLLDKIYQLIKLPLHILDELILGFCYSDFDMGNWWIWTRTNYHPCIARQPTNQVC